MNEHIGTWSLFLSLAECKVRQQYDEVPYEENHKELDAMFGFPCRIAIYFGGGNTNSHRIRKTLN